MDMPQISATENYLGKMKNGTSPEISKLNFTQLTSLGMSTTFDAGSFITDSASAGTAIASGNKTLSGVINMDPTKTTKFQSIAEMAKAADMKVGIVSSVSIDHATPASFYAHQPTRSNYYDIEIELGKSGFDYFGGGGFLTPKGKDNDKADAFDEAKKNGYKVVNTKEEFNKLDTKSGKILAVSPVLDSEKALPYSINKNTDGITLADFTQKGIDVLDNQKGFFMMVEGGKVDWSCHANDASTTIQEVIAFDDAVKKAIDFYNKHKDETLIITTADHETGGLGIGFAGTDYSTFFDKLGKQNTSYDEFTNKVNDYRKSGHMVILLKMQKLKICFQ
jgi:alkaline phosphatase